MPKPIKLGSAIITLVESKAICPHCERLIPFAEIESKWMEGNGHIKIKCKCNRTVGIASDIQGDFRAYSIPKKQSQLEKCLDAIGQFGGATMTTDPFEKVALLILRNGKIADHILLTKKQAEKLTALSYEKESVGMGRVKYFFKPA